MMDVTGLFGGTDREIGHRRIPAGEARTAVIRRRYDAPVQEVWDACTDPDRLSRWFLKPSGDLRLGGTFSLQDNAAGEILRCEAPRLLTVTWTYGDRPVDEVELRLTPGSDGGTLLELEHATVTREVEIGGRLVDVFANDPESGVWGVGTGWEMGLVALEAFLRGGFPAPPGEGEAPPAEVLELADRMGEAWAVLVRAANAGRTETPGRGKPAQG